MINTFLGTTVVPFAFSEDFHVCDEFMQSYEERYALNVHVSTADVTSHLGLFCSTTIVGVPIPGESDWSRLRRKNTIAMHSIRTERQHPKRRREDFEDVSPGLPSIDHTSANINRSESSATVYTSLRPSFIVPVASDSYPLLHDNFNDPPVMLRLPCSRNDVERIVSLGRPFEFIGILQSNSIATSVYNATEEGNEWDCEREWKKGRIHSTGQDTYVHPGSFESDEEAARNPPIALVPRVHVFVVRNLPSNYPLALLKPTSVTKSNAIPSSSVYSFRSCAIPIPDSIWNTYSTAGQLYWDRASHQDLCATTKKLVQDNQAQFSTLRRKIIELLTTFLCGDELAAEYFLLHLLSAVNHRRHAEPIGKIALNLSNLPSLAAMNTPIGSENDDEGREVSNAYDLPLPIEKGASEIGQYIHSILRHLCPRAVTIPISIDTLNTLQLCPHKDIVQDRLRPGALLLAPGTPLVLDELVLSKGDIKGPTGMQNISAIQVLITKQLVPVDFVYQTMEIPADITVLSLSHGKSMLPCDVRLPFSQDCAHSLKDMVSVNISEVISEAEVEQLREYVAKARTLPWDLPQGDISSYVESSLQSILRENRGMTQNSLSTMLSLTRAHSLSLGCTEATKDHWDYIRALEAKRLQRIQAVLLQ